MRGLRGVGIRGVLDPLFGAGMIGGGDAVLWYLAGGIDPANCVAAYKAIGATDYATSKVNLANPGTYDLSDGAAFPAWDAVNGWTFTAALSQYLTVASALTTDVPLTMVCRVKINDANNAYYLMSICDTAARNFFVIYAAGPEAGDPVNAQSVNAVASAKAVTYYNFTAGSWFTAGGIFATDSDRRTFINGGSKGTESTARDVVGLDHTYIGAVYSTAGLGGFTDGYMSHCAFYNIAITDEQMFLISQAMGSAERPPGMLDTGIHNMSYPIIATPTDTYVCYLGGVLGVTVGNEWAMKKTNSSLDNFSSSYYIGSSKASDNHNYPNWAIDSSGYIHVLYGCHISPLYYRKSTNPYDISQWGAEVSLAAYATYPKIVIDSSDNIYAFYRGGEDLTKHRYIRMLKSINGGTSWAAAVDVVDSGIDSTWAYIADVEIGSDDSLHLIWFWRITSGGNDPAGFHDVMYMVSHDAGATWEESDGTPYSLPVVDATAEKVAVVQYVIASSIKTDASNSPHMMYIVSNHDTYFTNNHIHYCYLSGGVWQDITMDGEDYGVPHIVIDGTDFYIFVTQLISGTLEVVQIKSVDSGANWTLTQLTSSSTANNHHVVPTRTAENGIQIVWNQGTEIKYMAIT